jgi:hypothetical protein
MDGKWFMSEMNVASYFIEKKGAETKYDQRRPKGHKP